MLILLGVYDSAYFEFCSINPFDRCLGLIYRWLSLLYKRFESNTIFILSLLYLATGLVQFVSAFDLLTANGYSKVVSFCLAVVLGYLPALGTVLGFIGALRVWHFSLFKASLAFLPSLILLFFVLFVLIVGGFKKRNPQ